jgi:hypothetical protein
LILHQSWRKVSLRLWRKTNRNKNRMPDHFANIAQRISAFIHGSSAENFEALALDLYALQRQHNTTYAKLGGSREVTSWEQIPQRSRP